jgi:hypothetical protein
MTRSPLFSGVLSLHPSSYNPHPTPYTLHTTHYALHTTHYTLHTTHYTLHTTLYTLHRPPFLKRRIEGGVGMEEEGQPYCPRRYRGTSLIRTPPPS